MAAAQLVPFWDAFYDELIKGPIFLKGFLLTCLRSTQNMEHISMASAATRAVMLSDWSKMDGKNQKIKLWRLVVNINDCDSFW